MKLKKELFKTLLNTKFTITFDKDNQYDAELVEIKEHDFIESLDLEPFTLTFRADKDLPIFTQRLYDIHSESLGNLTLFLIPRRPDEKGIYYDSVIQ